MFEYGTRGLRRQKFRSRRPAIRFEALETRRLLDAAAFAAAEGEGLGETVPTFQLLDVNPTSSTHNQSVGPNDFAQQTTLWYFGHST